MTDALLYALWAATIAVAGKHARQRLAGQTLAGPAISVLLMGLLWHLPVPTVPGLPLHFLGVTAAVLLCGPSVAYLQVCLLAVVFALPGQTPIREVALYGLLAGGLPTLATAGLLRLARRRLPSNVFVFIFVNACLAGALGMLCYVVARELALADAGSARRGFELALLMPLPEAILTGTVIAPLVAFRSHLVRCFDPDRYFR